MKKEYQLNSELQNIRYVSVTAHNVFEVRPFNSVLAGSTLLEPFMAFSYSKLVEELKQQFGLSDTPSDSATQQYRNHLSTLNGYLAFCGKTLESNVGVELGSQFDNRLREYLSAIDVAERTRRDRTTHLKAMRKLFQSTTSISGSPSKELNSFSSGLRKAIARTDISPEKLAKQAGIPKRTLYGWLQGRTPRENALPALHRVESFLGLARDNLACLITRASMEDCSAKKIPAHRSRMAKRTPHGLRLPESTFSDELRHEWHLLFDYKVSSFPTLERQSKGHWRLIPVTMTKKLSALATRNEMACPTANIFLEHLRTFLGVVINLSVGAGGVPWAVPPLQTLALAAHPRALECYLQWLTNQSGGVRHNGHRVFARAIASLVRPETGFLWQQPHIFRGRLPQEIRPIDDEAWRRMCERSHKFLREYIRGATGFSRNPEEPIEDLLTSKQPLKPILEAIERIEDDAVEAPPGSITEARHKRNALILALLVSNPLRARTLSSLTWLPNGHGTVRGSAAQGWRILLQPMHIKTGDSKQSKNYSVKIADWVKPMVDAYIEEYRETLLDGKTSQYFLVGDQDGDFWEALSDTVLMLTRKYIPSSPGFGPHAIRHLVATDWLRNNPGDFLTVAELLNDSIATVLANYAHLQRDDSFARYEAYISTLR